MVETLEDRLRSLGAELEFRNEAALADDVVAALDDQPVARRSVRRLLVAAVVLLLMATAVIAAPGARRTVARWLGFDSLRIERVDVVAPTALPSTTTAAPAALTLGEAADRVGVRPLVAPALGDPIGVDAPLGRSVVVRYEEALVVTLPGTLDEGSFVKLAGVGVDVTELDLFGGDAYWISGALHVFMYVDADGEIQESRPSLDALVWQRGSDVVRVEGAISLERAVEIARSVREP